MIRKTSLLIKAIEKMMGKTYYTTMNQSEHATAMKEYKSIV